MHPFLLSALLFYASYTEHFTDVRCPNISVKFQQINTRQSRQNS